MIRSFNTESRKSDRNWLEAEPEKESKSWRKILNYRDNDERLMNEINTIKPAKFKKFSKFIFNKMRAKSDRNQLKNTSDVLTFNEIKLTKVGKNFTERRKKLSKRRNNKLGASAKLKSSKNGNIICHYLYYEAGTKINFCWTINCFFRSKTEDSYDEIRINTTFSDFVKQPFHADF